RLESKFNRANSKGVNGAGLRVRATIGRSLARPEGVNGEWLRRFFCRPERSEGPALTMYRSSA
ncbi:MAG: hypothetical protein ABI969_15425, partial [bacterium]